MEPALWPHQGEAIAAAVAHLRNGGRATVVAACGTGKTRIGAESARRLGSGRVLVVVPTLDLLAQTVHVYRDLAGDRGLGRVVAVSSDRTVSRRQEIDLRAQQAEVTTDPHELHRLTEGAGRCTVFTTYASLAATVALAHRALALPAWDLVVVDEAHRTAGAQGRPWSSIHDDQLVPATRRLYLTATPRLMAAGAGDSVQVASMDDPAIFGPVVYELRFAQAIDLGLLADYRVVVSVISDGEVREVLRRHPALQVGHRPADPSALAAQLALLRCVEGYGLRRVITFHNRVARARHLAQTLPHTIRAVGGDPELMYATYLSGAHRPRHRRQVLDELRGSDERVVVVANAKVLAEGVDVPAVDAVVFADPRGSTIDAIQAVGRALRRGHQPDKTATIVVPVVVTPGQDPELTASHSPYVGVWEILRALRAHDQRAAVTLDALAVQYRQRQPGRAEPALPGWLRADGAPLSDGLLRAVTITAVPLDGDAFEQRWQRYLAAASQFRDVHGHLRVPQKWISPDGLALGAWIATQRWRHADGRLALHRVATLDALDMVWDPRADRWAVGYQAAQAYASVHGHLHPTAAHATVDGFRLGGWLNEQRARADELPPARVAALGRLDPEWNPPWDRHWQRGLLHARQFHTAHGHLDVPLRYVTADGYTLGYWVTGQRDNAARLTPGQRAALNALGMNWTAPPARERWWQDGLTAAAAFRTQHGHLEVSATYVTPNGFKLGTWITNIRRRHDAHALTLERRTALDALGMVWRPRRGPQPGAAGRRQPLATRSSAAADDDAAVPVDQGTEVDPAFHQTTATASNEPVAVGVPGAPLSAITRGRK